MQKFDKLTGIAAPLNILNVDTDMIIPKQFLKTIKRSGLGPICLTRCGSPGMAPRSPISC
jgi:3-isopropylmalate dehydratase small subunit